MVTNVPSNTNNLCSAQRDMNGDSCCFSPIQAKDNYNCKQTVLKTGIKELSLNC